jgi:predicted enzyme related to lactoylglutathione lyase
MSEAFQRHGAFSWCELMTTDIDAARRFYTELLGWSTEEVPLSGMMAGMTYIVVKAGGSAIGGIMPMPSQAACVLPHWGSYVTVQDVDTTARHAEALGAKTLVPPTDIPNVGRFCTFQDPQGAVISAITYRMT